MSTKVLGRVGVDSGTLVLFDPCYLDLFLPTDPVIAAREEVTNDFCDLAITATDNQDCGDLDKPEMGLAIKTGGDGCFTVLGHYDDDDRLISVEINFNGN